MKNTHFTTALLIFALACVSESTAILAAGTFIRPKRLDDHDKQSGREQLPIWQPAVRRIQVQGV